MNTAFALPASLVISTAFVLVFSSCNQSANGDPLSAGKDKQVDSLTSGTVQSTFDSAAYDRKMLALSNGDTTGKWPVKTVYPLPGAIFPDHRVIAYYGNLYSKRMGILGELPKDEMIAKLKQEVAAWQAADSSVKTIPALHYVATTAQVAPGADGKYRMRLPHAKIDTVVAWAREINALIFLDIQVGHSTVKAETPVYEKYLQQADVHFGIDPEFSMKNGERPGSKIGTFTAADINDAIDYLAELVRKHNLPPKILVVHRFTQGMITNYQDIKKVPEVQVVIDMDGFGDKILKRSTWLRYVFKEPVQFTGFKLFYKNDTKNTSGMYSPEELLKFTPKPIYIQYQ